MITKITYHATTDCDYTFFTDATQVDLDRNSDNVRYGEEYTKLGMTFESDLDPLLAGDPEQDLNALELQKVIVKRKKIGNNFLKEVAEIPYLILADGGWNIHNSFIDYSAVHGEQYQYYFIPVERDDSDFPWHLGTPIVTDILPVIEWDHWTLLLGDNYINQDGKEDTSKVIINKLFLFELNVSSGQMNLGTKYSQQENFTPYPKIQKNYSHNWSGTLKGLLGMIAPNDVDFIQTPNMLQEWKNLAQNTQRKFLKDRDGNLWEIELTAAPSINNTDNLTFDLKEKTLSWTEVADASNVALYSYEPSTEWILTETGYPNPLNSYTIIGDKMLTSREILTSN